MRLQTRDALLPVVSVGPQHTEFILVFLTDSLRFKKVLFW